MTPVYKHHLDFDKFDAPQVGCPRPPPVPEPPPEFRELELRAARRAISSSDFRAHLFGMALDPQILFDGHTVRVLRACRRLPMKTVRYLKPRFVRLGDRYDFECRAVIPNVVTVPEITERRDIDWQKIIQELRQSGNLDKERENEIVCLG